jgi:ring-1,2-phenylacetyl-CoA epoxidase subunit PaaD
VVNVTSLTAAVWAALDRVLDPEVPALSVVELGIVRDVDIDERGMVTVSITPTYSGCPAMRVIEQDILAALASQGWPDAQIRTVYSPAWTTDWLGETARQKLTAYGIAPPPPARSDDGPDLVHIGRRASAIPCPYCGSVATVTRSEFGSTACKAVMYCDHCHQPFELFKSI